MYAIIETGGKQYRVQEGDKLNIEKLPAAAGEEVKIGTPLVEGARVTLRVLRSGKGKKIIVFKFKAKKNYRRKQGHRQPFSQVIVEKIEV